jgi:dynein light chain 1
MVSSFCVLGRPSLFSHFFYSPYNTRNKLKYKTSTAQALKAWEAKTGTVAAKATQVKMCCQGIIKMDASLNALGNCECLSLSTNQIDRMVPLAGMKRLRILSLGRNQLKKVEKLEDVGETLEELWLSYNLITSLDGLASLNKLTTLFISNNQIKAWSEIDKLAALPNLRDVLLVGNPIYDGMSKDEARVEILRRLPSIKKIDGDLVTPLEKEKALGVSAAESAGGGLRTTTAGSGMPTE